MYAFSKPQQLFIRQLIWDEKCNQLSISADEDFNADNKRAKAAKLFSVTVLNFGVSLYIKVVEMNFYRNEVTSLSVSRNLLDIMLIEKNIVIFIAFERISSLFSSYYILLKGFYDSRTTSSRSLSTLSYVTRIYAVHSSLCSTCSCSSD